MTSWASNSPVRCPVSVFAASMAALLIARRLRDDAGRNVKRTRVGAALIMAAAISGMHYAGMMAADFPAGAICGAAKGVKVAAHHHLKGGTRVTVRSGGKVLATKIVEPAGNYAPC